MKKERIQLIDTIRGLVLFSMILYHASWNLVYIYGVSWPWFHSKAAYIWQQSICWTFIFLSGFCFPLAKRHLKSGCLVFSAGIVVTLATLIVMPENRVVFGVLTCIGSCILLAAMGEKWLRMFPTKGGLLLSFVLFICTKHINAGTLGLGNIVCMALPKEWYCNYVTTFLGFPFPKFFSTDYFSLMPWCFLFMTGFYSSLLCEKKELFRFSVWRKTIPVLDFAGRHSLIIYLLHQPLIYAIQESIF